MARILLGVSGGIAAYKTLELTRLAIKAGHAVRVIETESARRFVGPASFAGITGAPVLTTEWEPDELRGAWPGDEPPTHAPIGHLGLVERADVFLVAPASANTIAKLATGQADNLLTAAALACRKPLIVAPAMNAAMYEHAATQANLATLRARGAIVLQPGTGSLASKGEEGIGRLPEPPELLAAIEETLAKGGPPGTTGGRSPDPGDVNGDRRWSGLKVLVTAGGTREPIDAVRFVGNRSSGRMGFALADAAARRGATVTVVAANVGLPRTPGITYVDVSTAAELAAAARERFADADVLFMAAAVADYRPAAAHEGKLKKEVTGDRLTLELERTEDVLAGLAERRREGQRVIGFAAEHGEGALAYARDKLNRKGLDAVVLNDVSDPAIGFESPDNEVVVVTPEGEVHLPRAAKADVAGAILDVLLKDRSSKKVKVPR